MAINYFPLILTSEYPENLKATITLIHLTDKKAIDMENLRKNMENTMQS